MLGYFLVAFFAWALCRVASRADDRMKDRK